MILLTTSEEAQELKVIPRTYPVSLSGFYLDDYKRRVILDGGSFEYNPLGNIIEYRIADIKLRDESKNTSVTYSDVFCDIIGGYLTLSQAFSLVEGRFYELTILDGVDVIYRDKVFCTDQDVDQATNDYYSVNKNVYTAENSYDNEFIVI